MGDGPQLDAIPLSQLLAEVIGSFDDPYIIFRIGSTDAGKALLRRPRVELRDAAMQLLKELQGLERKHRHRHQIRNSVVSMFELTVARRSVLTDLLRRKIPFSDRDIRSLLRWSGSKNVKSFFGPSIEKSVLRAAANLQESQELSGALVKDLERLLKRLQKTGWEPDTIRRIESLLGIESAIPIEPGEAWSDVAISDLQSMGLIERTGFERLLVHCQSATGSKPSRAWMKEADAIATDVGYSIVVNRLANWFELVDRPRTRPLRIRGYIPDPQHTIIDRHADLLRGFCWACSLQANSDVARSLGTLATSAYRKIPGVGPRAVKIGNAAVYALGQMPGMDAVGQLAMLRVKVKFGTAQKGIEKALDAAAEREGIPRDEIEEIGVPAYGLEEAGLRTGLMGEFTARLAVTGTSTTELRWIKADGKMQKTVPAAVKQNFADELKELKAAGKDIVKMLSAQRDRIDQLFLQEKRWSIDTWRERYLDHPLVGTIARRLIWLFGADDGGEAAVAWLDGQLVDAAGEAVDISGFGEVRLWHPIGREIEEVLAWREFFESREIRQPFKQAHREVYLLTDAERNTEVYSNRFAAHILRQHQFNALCAARGWKNTLRLLVDDEFPPAHRVVASHGLRAEFWIEGAGEEYETDTNETGVFYRLVTDQVRFYRIDAAARTAHAGGGGYGIYADEGPNAAIRLDEVPAIVLSEIMRDVDLFVGVSSVGNDPNWQDGGPQGHFAQYWASYAFGDLSATAQTRKDILDRLLPRLAIGPRCSIDGKFLIVRGSVRTYKIHLGSGNILMEPNDQYLCIVASAGLAKKSDKVFLPFEGDRMLAVILSKALLLAADDEIKDRTILSQIRR